MESKTTIQIQYAKKSEIRPEEKWVRVSDIVRLRDYAIKEAEENNGGYDEWTEAEAYQIINSKINELSQSNDDGFAQARVEVNPVVSLNEKSSIDKGLEKNGLKTDEALARKSVMGSERSTDSTSKPSFYCDLCDHPKHEGDCMYDCGCKTYTQNSKPSNIDATLYTLDGKKHLMKIPVQPASRTPCAYHSFWGEGYKSDCKHCKKINKDVEVQK